MKKEIRIPTIIGLVLMIISIGLGYRLTSKPKSFSSKASGDCRPQNIQTTNITGTTATVSFVTTGSCLSSLKVDNRTFDQNTPSTTHYFQVNQLQEKTAYLFELILAGSAYHDSTTTFTTAATPSGNIPTSNLAWGKIYDSQNKPASGSIVFLNLTTAAPLSSLIDKNGFWSISLATSLDQSKSSWYRPNSQDQGEIIVISPDLIATQVAWNPNRSNPVVDIYIGHDQLSFLAESSPTSAFGQVPTPATITLAAASLVIINPKDGETLPVLKPEFFGSASKNSRVSIKIESPTTYVDTVSTDQTGSWRWSPPSELAPGPHTITVSTKDPNTGASQIISRQFYVLAAESNGPNFTASNSASLVTPSPSPTIVPTSTPDPPTPTTPVRSAYPSTSSAVPTTGNFTPTVLILLTAVSLFVFGIILSR